MATSSGSRIAERKVRDKKAREAQILEAARRIAAEEGWPSVTVRRLSDEIAYSQPVLYSHFASRQAVVDAVAILGFQELGEALEAARARDEGSAIKAVAEAYLQFAASSAALYEAMFTAPLAVAFAQPTTPASLQFAFSQLLALFRNHSSAPEVVSELFWASLHGLAELTRTGRLPPERQRERLRLLTEQFTAALR